MPVTNRWGEQNRLIRRVRQHGAMATIFRAPSTGSTPVLAQAPGFVLGMLPAPEPHQTESQALPETASVATPIQEEWGDAFAPPATPITTPVYQPQSARPRLSGEQRALPAPPTAMVGATPTLPRVLVTSTPQVQTQPVMASPSALAASLSRAQVVVQTSPATPSLPADAAPTQPAAVQQPPPEQSAVARSSFQQPARVAVAAQAQPVTPPRAVSALLPDNAPVVGQSHPETTPTTASAAPPSPLLVQRQTQTAPRQVVATPSTPGQGLDDPTWSRLQAIYRAHKARAAAEANSDAATPLPDVRPSTAPVQRIEEASIQPPAPATPLAVAQTAPAVEAVIEPFIPGQPLAPKVGPTTVAPSSTGPTVMRAPLEGLQPTETDPVGARTVAQATPQTAQPLPGAIDTTREPQRAASASSLPHSGAIQRADPQHTAVDGGESLLPNGSPSAVESLPALMLQEESEAGFFAPTASSALNPLDAAASTPLQAVWPVQRAETPTTSSDFAQVAQPFTPVTEVIPDNERAEVRRRVETIQAGQPTDSRIDIVTPRRPRPIYRNQPIGATTTASQPALESAPPLLQRQSAGADHASVTASAPATPAQVETEIGALPADLWRLIGEQPPVAPASAPAPGQPLQRSAQPSTGQALASKSLNIQTGLLERDLSGFGNLTGLPVADFQTGSEQTSQSEIKPLQVAAPMAEHNVGADLVGAIAEGLPPEHEYTQAPASTAPLQRQSGSNDAHLGLPTPAPMAQTLEERAHFVEPYQVVQPAASLAATPSAVQRVPQAAETEPVKDMPLPRANEEVSAPDAAPRIEATAMTMDVPDAEATAIAPPRPPAPARRQKRSNSKAATTIQRQSAAPSTATDSAGAETDTEAAGAASAAPAAEIDTDELARQVYTRLKRKLAIERERLR